MLFPGCASEGSTTYADSKDNRYCFYKIRFKITLCPFTYRVRLLWLVCTYTCW